MLTKKQKEVLDYITDYIKDEGVSPNKKRSKIILDSKALVVSNDTSSTYRTTTLLVTSGMPEEAFNWSIKTSSESNLPLLGSIAAGNPIEAIESSERIEVPAHLFNPKKTNFCLQISGDSMIDKGIIDGDIVIIEKKTSGRTR